MLSIPEIRDLALETGFKILKMFQYQIYFLKKAKAGDLHTGREYFS